MSSAPDSRDGGLTARIAGAVGVLSALVTIGLTVWNARTANALRAIELQHQTQQLALEEARDRVARYQFVKDLSTSIFTKDASQQLLAINLVQLTLTSDEAKVFFNGFRSSTDPGAREFGRIGIANLETQQLANRVQLINSPDRDTRLRAMSQLTRENAGDPTALSLVLDLFEEDRLDRLSASGRINALYFLNATTAEAWTPELRQRGSAAVSRLEERNQSGLANIGPETRTELDKLKRKLSTLAR